MIVRRRGNGNLFVATLREGVNRTFERNANTVSASGSLVLGILLMGANTPSLAGEKMRERMETLESLAASLAQKFPNEDIIESESAPGYDGPGVSISCSSKATPNEWQPIFPQPAEIISSMDTWDSTTAQLTVHNTVASPGIWESATWDYMAEELSPSALAIAPHARRLPQPESILDSQIQWISPTHVDPSVLVNDHHQAGLDQCSTTASVKCNCANPHFLVLMSVPGPFSTTEVRVLKVGPLAPAPDPYTNRLRLETTCTLAALDALRLHVGIAEEMVCDDESPSPFYRSIGSSEDSAFRENMIRTVQRTFKTLKPDLRPSSEQITVDHPPYIDLLPFQTVRKNLVLRQHEVDDGEFLVDILTGLVCWGGAGLGKRDRNASTGYASTGSPWDCRSWEAKGWFLKKYWSILGGEDGELVQQSEWWRSIRGEEPLDIEELA